MGVTVGALDKDQDNAVAPPRLRRCGMVRQCPTGRVTGSSELERQVKRLVKVVHVLEVENGQLRQAARSDGVVRAFHGPRRPGTGQGVQSTQQVPGELLGVLNFVANCVDICVDICAQ